jgi:hypothetical protein
MDFMFALIEWAPQRCPSLNRKRLFMPSNCERRSRFSGVRGLVDFGKNGPGVIANFPRARKSGVIGPR